MALMGQMMQMPLMISSLIVHAARHFGDTEIVSKRAEGDLHRTTWKRVELRSRKVAQALGRLGCKAGDRVATLAWNGYRHLEIYYGASGSQLVCHTINPRLFPEQIAWIANDAQDKVLCFDLTFLPLIEKVAPALKSIQHYVLMTDRAHMPAQTAIPNLLCYDELVEAEDGKYVWPQFDENTASSICYTSGTTGNPKGAVYSHRSSLLHAYAVVMPDAMDLSSKDVVLPVVPMFHVNAWGLPYSMRDGRREARVPRPAPGRQVVVRAVRIREGHVQRRRADRLARPHQLREGQRPQVQHLQAHGGRRLGDPAGDDAHAGRGFRPGGDARLGHDRAVAAGHAVEAEGQAPVAVGRRAAPHPREAGQGDLRHRHGDRRRRRPAAAVGRQAPRATWSCAARG